jgi:succinyl-diaminopimelate desuccinylase
MIGIGGGTVAAAFRRRGLPVAVWATMDDTGHQADEYARLDNLMADAKIFLHVFLQPR